MQRPAEPLRKSIHLALGILPVAAWWGMGLWPDATRMALVAFALVVFALDRLRLVAPLWSRFIEALVGPLLREEERRGLLGSTLMFLAMATVFLAFPPTVALAAMLFLMVGDAAAAVVGGRFGRHRLSGSATVEGSLACLMATLAVVALVAWLDPGFPLPTLVVGAGLATLIEAIVPGKFDNAAVPLVSGAAMRLLAMGR